MRKIILCLMVCFMFILPIHASVYESLTYEQKTIIQNELNFYQKLKTCSVASFSGDKIFMQINGIKNGMCDWDMNYGTSGVLNMKCKAPISATSDFATTKMEFLKEMYGIKRDTNFDAFDKISKGKYADTYCR